MQTTIVTLAEVANQFQLWRDRQNSKFSPIPIHRMLAAKLRSRQMKI